MASNTTYSTGEVIGLLRGLAEEMAFQMAQGYSVKLDGIGNFTASLTLCEGKERESEDADSSQRNARNIAVGGVNFRTDKKLIAAANRHCRLSHSKKKVARSSQEYTPEQRLKQAQQYLEKHFYMTVADYARLTGLRHTAALLELKAWAAQAESGISFSGRDTHQIYISCSPQKNNEKETALQ